MIVCTWQQLDTCTSGHLSLTVNTMGKLFLKLLIANDHYYYKRQCTIDHNNLIRGGFIMKCSMIIITHMCNN